MSEEAGLYRVRTRAGLSAALRSNIKSITKAIAGGTFNSKLPDPDVVLYLFDKHSWSQTFIASMLRVDVSTVRRWTANPKQTQFSKIPYAQWLLLLILADEIDLSEVALPLTDELEEGYKAG